MREVKRTEYMIVRDKFWPGVIGDLFMYSCLGGLYYLNYKVLGNSWIVDLIVTFLVIGMVVNVFSGKYIHSFYSYDETLEWLKKQTEKED